MPWPTMGGRSSADEKWLRSIAAELGRAGAPPAPWVPEGTVIAGRYRVQVSVGAGGMAVVYRALDLELDRRIAIKLYNVDSDEREMSRVTREGRAMARLSHPNVLVVHGLGEYSGRLFVAMEYVDGGTLRDWFLSRPDWRAVVDVFAQCGRGLAAAHAIGIVHRDFKPENVLIGRDGRPRIADFGLARALSGEPTPPSSPGVGTVHVTSTRTSGIAGTPQYISPEQYRGHVDERADQFAFCVALCEGLYGVHPFVGTTGAEIVRSIRHGVQRPEPRASDVPQGIHDAVMRGLERDPADRFATMDRLVTQLERDQPRRRWKLTAAVALGAMAGLAWVRPDDAEPCAHAGAGVDELWNATRAGELASAFASTSSPLHEPMHRQLVARIDAWAEKWRDVRTTTCEAMRAGDESTALLDRSVQCLDVALGSLGVALDTFDAADRTTVARTLDILAALPSVESCADRDALSAVVPLPTDPQLASAVAAGRLELARARASFELGHYTDAIAIGKAVHGSAAAAQFPALRAEVGVLIGTVQARLAEHADARSSLEDAFHSALAAGDDGTAGQAATELVCNLAPPRDTPASVHQWVETAASQLARTHADASARATLRMCESDFPFDTSDYAEAERLLRDALAELGPDPRDELLEPRIRTRLGHAMAYAGRYDEALAEYELAHATAAELRGPTHPVALAARRHIARTKGVLGAPADALAIHLETLQSLVAILGADAPTTLSGYAEVASSLEDLAAYPQAVAYLERSIAGVRGSPDQASVLAHRIGALANVVGVMGETERSLALHRESLRIVESTLGTDHVRAGEQHGNIATQLSVLGRRAEAREEYERAGEILEARLGTDNPRLLPMFINLVVLSLNDGDLAAAQRYAERGERCAEENDDANLAGGALDASAEVARARGDHAAAHALQLRAVEIYERLEPVYYIDALHDLAQDELALGRPRDALETLARAKAVAATRAAPPWTVANLDLLVGEARWAIGEHRDARAITRHARDTLDSLGHVDQRDEADEWLAQHR